MRIGAIMKATNLYSQLKHDFAKDGMTDFNWVADMEDMAAFVCDDFKQHYIGLMCDFAYEITKVYTAVFPSDAVLQKILDDGTDDAMLFTHHPRVWDLSKNLSVAWYDINTEILQQLKQRRISIFNYHVPLDSFGEYSTSKTLAEAVGITIKEPFIPYYGGLCAVWGYANVEYVQNLNNTYSQIVGHKTKLYKYGEDKLKDGKIAVVAGGGNDINILKELADSGINTMITGITVTNDYSKPAHDFAKKHGINLLGATHYSSEKFACIAMVNYFEKLGLDAEFVEDKPCFIDM